MDPLAIFGVNALMSLTGSAIFAGLYAWPQLRAMKRDQALVWLVTPHMFLRFLGLSFLVTGVVSPALPAGFAVPAAYGDLAAGVLAIIAAYALSVHASWTIPAVLIFNTWGVADFLLAFYNGPRFHLQPDALQAAYFIPTAIVPPLLITHILVFMVVLQGIKVQNGNS